MMRYAIVMCVVMVFSACQKQVSPKDETALDEVELGAEEETSDSPSAVAERPQIPVGFRPQSWRIPQHRAFEIMTKSQEWVGRCEPFVDGIAQPCKTTYTSKSGTVMEDFCSFKDPDYPHLLTSSIHTYAERGDFPDAPENRAYSVARDAQGRITELQGPSLHCTMTYDGDSERVVWRACEGEKGNHYVYDEQGWLVERYVAEKRTSDIATLQGWAPPEGEGFWSYVHEYEYDATGRVAVHRKCNGQTPRWCYHEDLLLYDAAGRLVSLQQTEADAAEATYVINWTYDERALLVLTEERASSWSRTTQIEYDQRDRPLRKTVGGLSQGRAPQGYVVEMAYEQCTPQ